MFFPSENMCANIQFLDVHMNFFYNFFTSSNLFLCNFHNKGSYMHLEAKTSPPIIVASLLPSL
jgi:hypothetical protein